MRTWCAVNILTVHCSCFTQIHFKLVESSSPVRFNDPLREKTNSMINYVNAIKAIIFLIGFWGKNCFFSSQFWHKCAEKWASPHISE